MKLLTAFVVALILSTSAFAGGGYRGGGVYHGPNGGTVAWRGGGYYGGHGGGYYGGHGGYWRGGYYGGSYYGAGWYPWAWAAAGAVVGAAIAYPYYSTPQVIVEQQPQVTYIQQQPQVVYQQALVSSAPPAPPPMWYFCQPSNAYYPQVQSCAAPWVQVAPR